MPTLNYGFVRQINMVKSKIDDTNMVYLGLFLMIVLVIGFMIYVESLPEEEKTIIKEQLKQEPNYEVDDLRAAVLIIFFTIIGVFSVHSPDDLMEAQK